MAVLWVVRHGETDWNRERRIQGHEDPPLNEVGRDQARDLVAELRPELERLDGAPLLYTSDLLRARMTAHALARGLGLRARRARYLRERMFGRAQGRTWDELARELPAEVEAYKSHRDRDAIPGSEPLARFRARALRGARRIAARVAERGAPAAVVVTHGGLVHVLLEEAALCEDRALGREPVEGRRFMIGNAARYKLEVQGETLRLVREEVVSGEALEA